MGRFFIFFVLVALPSTMFGVEKVTVEQLEQILHSVQGQSDGQIAARISRLELTEPLNISRIPALLAESRGEKARQAVIALVDGAAFLSPSTSDMHSDPPPEIALQRHMISQTVDYLKETVPRLPNFSATRRTLRYRESTKSKDSVEGSSIGQHRIYFHDRERETLVYRDGAETVDAGSGHSSSKSALSQGLVVRGVFGPVLSVVVLDAVSPHSVLRWSRWEQGGAGPIAVFGYSVLEDASHYRVSFCCVPENGRMKLFQKIAGYHGEIAIDPATGAILRLIVQADLTSDLPLIRADILVSYAPVVIAGKTYICPVRSVSISRSRTVNPRNAWTLPARPLGPMATSLNDVTFSDYHVFRSESRILPYTDPPDKIR